MGGCLTNEAAILKSVSVKLNDDTLGIIMFMYHTPVKENRDKEQSWYRYEGRVVKTADLKAEIAECLKDENRLAKWKWPSKAKSWNPDWFLMYDNNNDNSKAAAWYRMRMNKALDWETYLKQVRDGVKMTGRRKNVEKQSDSSKFDLEGYFTEDGQTVSIADKDALLKCVGKCFSKEKPLKRIRVINN